MDESEIPIDIHTNKLMDWLISRRHVPRDWQNKVITVREKINEAIKDMPVHEGITALLTGSYINYYHCQRIVEILKETESSSKNLFGQYSSKRMKDWLEIVKLYEKENVYLGEVASLLLRNVNYEVPALKKQIQKTIQLKNECDKKEKDYEKSADFFLNEFNSICKTLGIKGDKIKEELISKAADFPGINQKLANEIKKLKSALEFYEQTVHQLLNPKKEVLKMLAHVVEKGDTTVYEWKYNKVPDSVETNNLLSLIKSEDTTTEANDGIDFGTASDFDANIDFGDENIDWGISTEDSAGISVEVSEDVKSDQVKSKSEVGKVIAQGDDARTLLGNPKTRYQITNNILELEAFLKMRIHETESNSDGFMVSMLPDSLQMYDEKLVQKMLKDVQDVLKIINDNTSLHYLNITTNTRYVDQLATKLKQKLRSYEKMLASRDSVRTQREEIVKETEALRPKVDILIEKSKELQEEIEKDISKRYKGRPVNLMGGAFIL